MPTKNTSSQSGTTGRFVRTPQNKPTRRFQRANAPARAGIAAIAGVAGLALTSRIGRRRGGPPQPF